MKTNTVSTTLEKDDFPSHLSFHQYKSILSFENEKKFNENEEPIDESTFDMYMNWNTIMNDAKETYGKVSTSVLSSSSTSAFSSAKNNNQKMLPYVVCHLDDSSLCGTERYEILQSIFADLSDSASSDFIIDELPIYNHKVDHSNTKLKKEIENEKKDTVSGACYYSSLRPSLVQQVTEKNVFVTPLLSFLKLRRTNFKSNERDLIDTTTRAISVHLSPGHASSQDTVMEYAYGLLKVISKDLSTDITDTSSCNADMIKAFSSASVTVSSNDASVFYYEILTSSKNSIITHGCYNEFTEYLANQHETVSVELIAKTVLHNDIVRWIVESSVENSKPWSDIGLNGENQILQVSDSGLDESHCYFKDATGEVPLTTDFDLTGGRIDTTKRKVISYVALSEIGDRTDHSKHGSHVVGSILGKRSDDGVNEVPGLIDGIASASKVTFFDANDNPEDDMVFLIPLDISQMFYFGKQSQAFGHSASWGSNSNGGQYSSRSKEIDQYFYESDRDDFIMFVAAGNDGDTSGAKIDDPCQSKNVICVGASNSAADNLKTGMLDMNYIAFFSSRGPTADNRIKPDLIAPGYSVLSVNANSGSCDPSNRPQYEQNKQESAGTIFLSGTSMACPIVAGSAALVRQYFQEKHDPPMDISGTLLKAVLINGAQALIGRSVADTGSSSDASSPYDKFQAFGRINLLKSLKHPDDSYNSPDIHVEDERVLQQGQTHKYEFDVCDAHEFRVTIVWRDPPNGSEGCSKCLVNDLDLEVELNGQVYHPNGKSGKDDRNNVERVVLSEDDFPSSSSNTVIVKVRAANLGFGNLQAYSIVAAGCINEAELVTPTQSPTALCDPDQFELTLELFTNRKPEETSWLLEYQGSGGVIDAGIAGDYDKRLHSYSEKNCVHFGCFLFIIKDTAFDGLCCVKGMGSYFIYAGDRDEILVEGNSFQDGQEIQKFCHLGSDAIDPTTSPTILSCNENEFKYQIDIKTDLYPDETRWTLLKKPRIDGVDEGSYTVSYREYVHEGCLDLGGCYSFFVYGNIIYNEYDYGAYMIKADDFVVAEKESFDYRGKYKEFCYSGESSTPTYGIRTAVVGGNWGEKFDDVHPTWEYGKIVQVELYENSYVITFIGITYETGQSFEHRDKYGTQHIITLGEDQYITKVSGRADNYIRQLKFETNDGKIFGPYGSSYFGDPFEFDFGANALVYIFGRADWSIYQLGFAHASLPQTLTDSPTPQQTSFPCGDNQYRYEIIIRTACCVPEGIWWELNQVVESVPYMTYRKQLESYSHTGCLTIDGNYEFWMIDRRQDGLCCYFGSGSYKMSVDNNVVIRGNNFDDATRFGEAHYSYANGWWLEQNSFVYNKHEFSYSSTLQPTSKPIEMTCSDDEFEYRIRVITNYHPGYISWNFIYSNGDIIESAYGEYFLEHYAHNHIGCLPLNGCFEFYIESSYGLCCYWGNGGYTIFANDVVMAEGGKFWYEETKTFCYGPSYSQSPTSSPTVLVCDENEFKYEIFVTTDRWPVGTSWELLYDDGTIIDSVGRWYYSIWFTEYVHRGCLDLDSCVIFTIFDSGGDGLCCADGNGGYTIMANDVVMAEGGEFGGSETTEFCYGPSYSFSPSSSDVCENGSNNHKRCGFWASIGACDDDSGSQDWMLENCAKACSNCCMDYWGGCASHASEGYCTDTSFWWTGITWQEYMQGNCRVTCGTCYIDLTPSPTPPPVTCSDDQFKYEIVVTNDDDYYFDWDLYYKYPDLIDGYGIIDGSSLLPFPPNYEKRFYGCASYSCFDLEVDRGYVKMYDKDKDILIAQNTETREELRFCHYKPEPTTSPITSLKEAIFTITLSFSTTSLHQEEIVSSVSHRSIQKILFHFIEINEHDPSIAVEYSFCEEFRCDVSFRVCKNESCNNNNDDEVLQSDFLAFIANTLMEAKANGLLLLTLKQTGHHMMVAEIFDNIKNDIIIEFDFDYEAWPTTSPTTSPSSKPEQNCNQNLFTKIADIMQTFIQGMNNTFTNVTNSISGELFGVDTVNSTADLIQCKDKMFWLQVEIQTDRTPNKASWELLYENGTLIESVGQDTYSECNTTYKHSYCLDMSCFVFNLWDSFSFQGSYEITAGNSTLAQQDTFMWWKDTKRFCYPLCDDDDMFALQIDLVTDPWPHETSWQLAFENGTLVDSVAEGYYTGHNTSYSHRYCLKEGCYSVTFQDHIGDGMCCSYGKGSFRMKINDNVIREGGEFGDSVRKSFCHKTAETSEEDTTTSFLFGIITALFGDESCCTTDTTGYPTPVPSPFPTSQPSIQPSILPSSNPSILPSSNPSSKPSISSIPSSHPSSHPSSSPTTFCDENEFKYEVIVTTDYYPDETSWELSYDDGTIIDSVETGYYTDRYTEHVHRSCLDLDSCVIFTIYDSYGDGVCCFVGNGGYTIKADDAVMAEGGEFGDEETSEFCYGPSISSSPSSSPLVCDENEFKYEIIVTTDDYAFETSWELSYDDGTIIDSVEQREYTKRDTEHVHEGCLDLDSCVIFTIFDLGGDGLCCAYGNGGYTIKADDAVMAEGGEFGDEETTEFCYGPSISSSPSSNPSISSIPSSNLSSNPSCISSSNPSFIPTTTLQPSSHPSSNPTILVCDENEFKYEVIVTTDYYPDETSWEFSYDDGTIIDSVEEGEYTDYYYEHVHNGCLDLDSCVTFTIFDSYGDGLCCAYGNGGYTIKADDAVMAEGGEFGDEETSEFCYGPSISSSPSLQPSSHPSTKPSFIPTTSQPSSNPTILVCDENEFKYEVTVTTDDFPGETSWELSYDDGTIIDSVEQGEYTDYYYEHVHEGCMDLDSCVIFTIYDSYGDGLCCAHGNGGYTIMVNGDVMAEGGEFGDEETTEFCYPVLLSS